MGWYSNIGGEGRYFIKELSDKQFSDLQVLFTRENLIEMLKAKTLYYVGKGMWINELGISRDNQYWYQRKLLYEHNGTIFLADLTRPNDKLEIFETWSNKWKV